MNDRKSKRLAQRPEQQRQALIAELRQLQALGVCELRQALIVAELRADWELGWPPFFPYPPQRIETCTS